MGFFDWFLGLVSWLGLGNKSGKILGLDNAGKTTFIHMLIREKIFEEDLTIGNTIFKAIDLGGLPTPELWKDVYAPNVSVVVYMIDAADHIRFQESKKLLHRLLRSDKLQQTPFLILGNKIDVNGAVSEQQLIDAMGLRGMTTGKDNTHLQSVRPLEVFMCSIVKGMGYREGVQWLSSLID